MKKSERWFFSAEFSEVENEAAMIALRDPSRSVEQIENEIAGQRLKGAKLRGWQKWSALKESVLREAPNVCAPLLPHVRRLFPDWKDGSEIPWDKLIILMAKHHGIQPSEVKNMTPLALSVYLSNIGASADGETAQRLPADHYKSERGIPADRLASARRVGKLPGSVKVHGRWQYVESEVKALWPEDFMEPVETC